MFYYVVEKKSMRRVRQSNILLGVEPQRSWAPDGFWRPG